jgi:hypothetical protein
MKSDMYSLFGLSLASGIPLPELDHSDRNDDPDVVIRLGNVPLQEGEKEGQFTAVGTDGVLNIPGAGRYLVQGGRQIVVEPDPSGSERHLRLYLLGSAFGALLHQRGLMPLHSNAMEVEGRALAFTGPSGAGKSTMAAWFHDHGYNVLADDVCVITRDPEGLPLAQPGIPRLRLWRDALESSGRNAGDHDHAFDDADKYNVKTRAGESRTPVPLGAIYVLDEPNSGASKAVITQLSGVDAVDALVANTYRGAYIRIVGGTQRHLMQCLELARTVPIFRMERVWGFQAFSDQAKYIEDHARELARSSISPPLA